MALTVNGETVPEPMLAAETQSLLAQFRRLDDNQRRQLGADDAELDARAREWARENVIERVLMRQEAMRDAEPIPGDVFEQAVEAMYKRFGGKEKFAESGMTEDDIRNEAEAMVKLDRLLGRITARVKPPKTGEVAAKYRHEKERWRVGETIRAAHIVKHVNETATEEDARKAIDEAQAALDAGEPFEAVADRLSDCPGNGGDLGWFGEGKMVERFDAVVFALEPGERSKPFRTEFGFHIAKLVERRPATYRALDEVKAEIEREMKRELDNKGVEEYVDRLRAKAAIEDAEAVPVEAAAGD